MDWGTIGTIVGAVFGGAGLKSLFDYLTNNRNMTAIEIKGLKEEISGLRIELKSQTRTNIELEAQIAIVLFENEQLMFKLDPDHARTIRRRTTRFRDKIEATLQKFNDTDADFLSELDTSPTAETVKE